MGNAVRMEDTAITRDLIQSIKIPAACRFKSLSMIQSTVRQVSGAWHLLALRQPTVAHVKRYSIS